MEKWLEIDLDKLKQNVEALGKYIRVPIMAVVKQNAYGLGALPMARCLEQLGINFFAVTNVEEGIELRKGGVKPPILVFAPFFQEQSELDNLWAYDLTPAVYSLEAAETLNRRAVELRRPIDVHIKVDTGMGRMGFLPEELLGVAGRLKTLEGLKFQGIFTHFSNAYEKEMSYTRKQLTIFLKLVDELAAQGLQFPLKHCANSVAALKFPETHLDMVRIGSALLGNSTINSAVPLKKIYRCRARVLQVRTLQKGSYVGYSNTHQVQKETRAAVIPIGYTDGLGVQKRIDAFRPNDFLRELYHLVTTFLKPPQQVHYEGSPLKILGKTSLQLTVVGIGSLSLKPGDLVEVSLNPLLTNARMNRLYTGETAQALAGARVTDVAAEAAAAMAEAAAAGEQ